MSTEKERLENINFFASTGFNGVLLTFRYLTLQEFFKGQSCLELGCSDGHGTKLLLNHFKEVVVVDGSEKQIEQLKMNIPDSSKVHTEVALFEEYEPAQKFDTIVMEHILEHVEDPVSLLRRTKGWLKSNGVLLIGVPNALSLHRQLGVQLGMLKEVTDLNESDREIGHRRVYTEATLREHIKQAGLNVKETGGIFLKPLPNTEMSTKMNEQQIIGFYELGKKYPDIAAEIYAVCN